MDKKQTAVEWLIEQVNSNEYQKAFGQTYISVALVEQALAMEKEQIIDSLNDGWNMAKHSNFVNSQAEQYYKETYGIPSVKG
jgi:hypothetical protein